jgi:hypothetical protein
VLAINLMPPPLPFAEARQLALRADAELHEVYLAAKREQERLRRLSRLNQDDEVLAARVRPAQRAQSAAETAALHADPRAHAEYLRAVSMKNHARKPWYKGTDEEKAKAREDWGRMQADPKRAANRRATKLARYHERMAEDERFVVEQRLRARLRMAVARGMIDQRDEYGIDWAGIIEHIGPCPGPLSDYQVDHIRPLAAFDLNDPDQVREAFAPENHQWLTGPENCRKGSKGQLHATPAH